MWGPRSIPTRSISPKTPVLGRPIGLPATASASSTVSPRSIASSIAASIQRVPIRLAMKPGVSLHSTTLLPSRRSAKARTAATASGRVSRPETSSRRRM